MYAWFRNLFSDSPKTKTVPSRVAQATTVAEPPKVPVKRRSFADDDLSPMQRDRLDFMFSGWLFETEEHPDLFTNANEDAILAALDGVVKSNQSGADMVRRMPGVIPQLLQSLRSGDFSGADLARKISQDLVLVAEVLRLANSAILGSGKAISSIDHAILVIGQDGLRQLITGVAFKPIVNLNSGSFNRKLAPRLWAQSERCAVASRMLASESPVDGLEAFLAGLVNNVGLTVSLRVIDRMSDGRLPVGSPTFCNALASYGRTLSYNIGCEWHFPASVTTAIREQETGSSDGSLSPLGRVLAMADYLSKMDILARQGRLDTSDPGALEGLSEKEIACLAELSSIEDSDWVTAVSSGTREPASRAS